MKNMKNILLITCAAIAALVLITCNNVFLPPSGEDGSSVVTIRLAVPGARTILPVEQVFENYQDSGMCGYRTKGLENEQADSEIVFADNVVGKVVYASPRLGSFISYAKSNLWLLALMVGMTLVLVIVVRYLVKTRGPNKKNSVSETPQKSKDPKNEEDKGT